MTAIGYFALNLFKRAFKISKSCSYSQCGEDLIVSFLMKFLDIGKPTYLDIGAHHPRYLSNTFLFYKRGCRGVCIEPDPGLFRKIQNARRRDKCLNIGVGPESSDGLNFYIMSTPTLNTFSRQEAERYQSYGRQKIKKIVKIPLCSINSVFADHFPAAPDFVSLDVEGLDFQILKAIDFKTFRPAVFCIETLTYTEDRTEQKQTEIIDLMQERDYLIYADTYINTIFVEKGMWDKAHHAG